MFDIFGPFKIARRPKPDDEIWRVLGPDLSTIDNAVDFLAHARRVDCERRASEIIAAALSREDRHAAFLARSDRARALKQRPRT